MTSIRWGGLGTARIATTKVIPALQRSRFGRLRGIQSCFTYHNTDPANIRNRPETGGGGLMDIGCYCVSLARWLFGEEPSRVVAQSSPTKPSITTPCRAAPLPSRS